MRENQGGETKSNHRQTERRSYELFLIGLVSDSFANRLHEHSVDLSANGVWISGVYRITPRNRQRPGTVVPGLLDTGVATEQCRLRTY